MKKHIFLFIAAFALVFSANAQNDVMYIMKDGEVVAQYNVNTEIDSIIFYEPVSEGTTFTDARDGNVYKQVTIGNQTWMAENLRYLPAVMNTIEDIPAYYVNGYLGTNVEAAKAHPNYMKYGVLYNWYAAMAGASPSNENPSGVQGVCPDGWHLPSKAEWDELTEFVGGGNVAGGKLKATGFEYWDSPNTGATDEYGFDARGGGFHKRVTPGFLDLKKIGYWWSTTPHQVLDNSIMTRFAWNDQGSFMEQNYDKPHGFSVRCVKD